MRKLLTFFLLFAFLGLIAQERQIRKSKKWFEKGKYEKCISKSRKYLKKHRKNKDLQYYIVSSNIAIYDKKSASGKYYHIKRILYDWEKLLIYSNQQNSYSELSEKIIELVYLEIDNQKTTKKNIENLHLQLAEKFGDTTNYFRQTLALQFQTSLKLKESKSTFDTLITLDSIRKKLIYSAIEYIGVPYKYGGSDSSGFDCSGFTQYVYRKIGIELPHNAQLQSELGKLINIEEAQSGDIIFFGEHRASHAGLVFINKNGEAELIHCASRGVSHDTEEDNNHIYWMNRPYKVKSYINLDIHPKYE